MKKILGIAICIFAVLLIGVSQLDASGCVVQQRVVQQNYQANHAAAIVTPVVAAVFTPVVTVPAYSVGYADHYGNQQNQIQQLKNEIEIERLKNKVQKLEFDAQQRDPNKPQ